MAKQKHREDHSSEQLPVEEVELFWIYPGERRPVIVKAKNERHAKHKVSESPEYDGFSIYVYPVEKFSAKCSPKGDSVKLEDTPEERAQEAREKALETFLMVKVVGGIVDQVSAFVDKDVAKEEAQTLARHLNHETDDLRVFRLNKDYLKWPFIRAEASEMFSAPLVGSPDFKG